MSRCDVSWITTIVAIGSSTDGASDFGSRKSRSAWRDHRHRVRHARDLVAYEFRGADELLVDFFAAVERACAEEGSAFEFEAGEIELEAEEDDDAQVHD
jgi:hypothetical protein